MNKRNFKIFAILTYFMDIFTTIGLSQLTTIDHEINAILRLLIQNKEWFYLGLEIFTGYILTVLIIDKYWNDKSKFVRKFLWIIPISHIIGVLSWILILIIYVAPM